MFVVLELFLLVVDGTVFTVFLAAGLVAFLTVFVLALFFLGAAFFLEDCLFFLTFLV